MNGSRIALVLGFAGLAGLGLATPGILGTGARPEAAGAVQACAQPVVAEAPAALESAVSALETEPAPLAARAPACELAAATSAAGTEAASGEAPKQVELVSVETQRSTKVLYPVERSAAQRAISAKSAALGQHPDAAMQQRQLLARKLAIARMQKDNPAMVAQLLRAESAPVDPRTASARSQPMIASARIPVQDAPRADAVRPSEPQTVRDAAGADGVSARRGKVPAEIQAKLDRAAGKAPVEKLPPK